MATILDITKKIAAGTATADDFAELAKLSQAEADSKKKIEVEAKKVVDFVKKAEIDPQLLTNLLAQEGLIIVASNKVDEKTVIVEEPITTKQGRASTFKVWVGRDVNALTSDAKEYWTALKAKGLDYFKSKLNAEGKAYYETEAGKKWIDSLFGVAA
nr:hypothetical protein [uncultured Pseudogulbenkiania sp.]